MVFAPFGFDRLPRLKLLNLLQLPDQPFYIADTDNFRDDG